MNAVEPDFSKQGEKEFYDNFNKEKDKFWDVLQVYGEGPMRNFCIKKLNKLDDEKVKYERQRTLYFKCLEALLDTIELYKISVEKEKNNYFKERMTEEIQFLQINYLKDFSKDLVDLNEWAKYIENIDVQKIKNEI